MAGAWRYPTALGLQKGVLRVPAVVPIDIDVRKLSPGAEHKNYLSKATVTLIATVMGKLVSL